MDHRVSALWNLHINLAPKDTNLVPTTQEEATDWLYVTTDLPTRTSDQPRHEGVLDLRKDLRVKTVPCTAANHDAETDGG